MKRIFVSTDYERLNRVIQNRRDAKNINYINQATRIYFNINNNEFVVEPIDTDLILIKDASIIEDFFEIDLENDYLLHHTDCNHRDKFKESNCRYGQHDPRNKYYYPTFNYILDNLPNKAERIINFLFPPEDLILEAKLELLHLCLTPEKINNITWEENGIVKVKKTENKEGYKLSYKITVPGAKEKFNYLNGVFDEKYDTALEDLRDSLLP